MSKCEFESSVVASPMLTAVCRCRTHGVLVENYFSAATGARCIVGKAEDAAESVVKNLVQRIEALEAAINQPK